MPIKIENLDQIDKFWEKKLRISRKLGHFYNYKVNEPLVRIFHKGFTGEILPYSQWKILFKSYGKYYSNRMQNLWSIEERVFNPI
jgi:hypothetical protein